MVVGHDGSEKLANLGPSKVRGTAVEVVNDGSEDEGAETKEGILGGNDVVGRGGGGGCRNLAR